MDDEDILILILHGFPSDYATMKTIIRIKQSHVSIQDLRSLLLIAEEEIEQSAKSIYLPCKTAMTAYGDASRGIVPSHPFNDSSLPNVSTVSS
jgi:hypothetical protein